MFLTVLFPEPSSEVSDNCTALSLSIYVLVGWFCSHHHPFPRLSLPPHIACSLHCPLFPLIPSLPIAPHMSLLTLRSQRWLALAIANRSLLPVGLDHFLLHYRPSVIAFLGIHHHVQRSPGQCSLCSSSIFPILHCPRCLPSLIVFHPHGLTFIYAH